MKLRDTILFASLVFVGALLGSYTIEHTLPWTVESKLDTERQAGYNQRLDTIQQTQAKMRADLEEIADRISELIEEETKEHNQ